MKKLFKTTSVMSLATVAGIITGFFRAKITALLLGPSGVGIFSQAMTFAQSAETVCGLGIGLGVTKYSAEQWKNKHLDRIKGLILSSFLMQFISFAVLFLAAGIFSEKISIFLFSSGDYAGLMPVLMIAVLFSVFVITMESVLIGIERSSVFARARVIYYSAGVLLLFFMVKIFGLLGAFAYILINAFMTFFIVWRMLGKETGISFRDVVDSFKSGSKDRFFPDIKNLFSYGTVTLTTSAVSYIALLYVRSVIISNFGAEYNGYYQVVFAMVSYYAPFFTNGLWGYLLPKAGASVDNAEVARELNGVLRFTVLFSVPVIGLAFILKRLFILVVFSGQFIPALEIFGIYLFGSFFFLMVYMFGVVLLAVKKLRAYFFINLSHNLLYVILFTVTVSSLGFRSVAWAYVAANITVAAVFIAYNFKRLGIKIEKENLKLAGWGVAAIVFILFTGDNIALTAVKTVFIILWGVFVIQGEERQAILSFLKGGRK